MAEVLVEGELAVAPEEAWKVVGDFVGFIAAQGLPVEGEGEGVGMVRKIAFGGSTIVERLEELDEEGRRVVYSIVTGPLPVTDYRSTVQLAPAGDGRTRITWSTTFEPEGADAEQLRQMLSAAYRGGIEALQGRFGA